jgi:parallel beta-helix repeat protein
MNYNARKGLVIGCICVIFLITNPIGSTTPLYPLGQERVEKTDGFPTMSAIVSSTNLGMIKKIGLPIVRGNILYVGGSGPNNYTFIQDAIDNTSNGDLVYVFNGYYFENITIDTEITLIGEDKKQTIIDGYEHGTIITVNASNVTISGCTIQNAIDPLHFGWGSGIVIKSNKNTIYNNIIGSDNFYGIELTDGTHNNTIKQNAIIHNIHGMWIYESHDNFITHNTIFTNSVFGLSIFDSGCNTITCNNFEFNKIPAIIVTMIEYNNNTWHHNYWGRPRLFPKPILHLNLSRLLIPRIRFQYDESPADTINGKKEMWFYYCNNSLLRIKGFAFTTINASSWDGIGLHIGKLDHCTIQFNKTSPVSIAISNRYEGVLWRTMETESSIDLTNAVGIFFKRQSLFKKDFMPARHRVICFVEKGKINNCYWTYS